MDICKEDIEKRKREISLKEQLEGFINDDLYISDEINTCMRIIHDCVSPIIARLQNGIEDQKHIRQNKHIIRLELCGTPPTDIKASLDQLEIEEDLRFKNNINGFKVTEGCECSHCNKERKEFK